ncbi:MAG: hypothetical protein M3270_09090 [Thermoproteota archaeon]|nr:hypothetical protein [Thermoproteota archaeon]
MVAIIGFLRFAKDATIAPAIRGILATKPQKRELNILFTDGTIYNSPYIEKAMRYGVVSIKLCLCIEVNTGPICFHKLLKVECKATQMHKIEGYPF